MTRRKRLALVGVIFSALLLIAAATQIDLVTQVKNILPFANGGTGTGTNTKGDVLVGTGSAWAKLGVGADGLALVANSAATNGVNWAAPGASIAVNSQSGTSYTFLSTDKGKLVTFSNAAAIAATLPQATGSFGSGWFMFVENRGAGTLTITPTTSTIDGSATLALTTNQGVLISSNGTNYFVGARGTGSAGGGSITLQTNGVSNGSQTLLNLNAGSNVTLTDNGSGQITIAASSGGSSSIPINAQTGTSYTFVAGDAGKLVTFSNTAAIAATLPQSGSAGFPAGWAVFVENRNIGPLTITPSVSTIDGAASITLLQNQGVVISGDGTNYFVGAKGQRGTAINSQTGTSYTIAASDASTLISFSNSSTVAVTLPQAGGNFPVNWATIVENQGPGVVTITPTTSTIDGASSIVLMQNQGVIIVSDGANYFTGNRGMRGTAVNSQTGTSYTILASDQGKLLTFSNASAIAVTLPQAGGNFPATWSVLIENTGVGNLTITPTTSTIDGAASLVLAQNQGVTVVSDGTNYFTGNRGTGGSASVAQEVSRSPDLVPASPTAMDDEFNATDGTAVNTSLWTWQNQLTATATQNHGVLYLVPSVQSGNDLNVLYQAVPSTPWEVETKVTINTKIASFALCGLMVGDGTKLVTWGPESQSTVQLDLINWNTVTSASSTPFQGDARLWTSYLKVKDDGTNLIFSYSADGLQFITNSTVARTSFLSSVSRVGIFTDNQNTSQIGACSYSFFRRTL